MQIFYCCHPLIVVFTGCWNHIIISSGRALSFSITRLENEPYRSYSCHSSNPSCDIISKDCFRCHFLNKIKMELDIVCAAPVNRHYLHSVSLCTVTGSCCQRQNVNMGALQQSNCCCLIKHCAVMLCVIRASAKNHQSDIRVDFFHCLPSETQYDVRWNYYCLVSFDKHTTSYK